MVKVDVCVIGAGSGGLSVAAGSSQLGAQVVLVEEGKMGGDCLNYGCVPSKSLIAAAKKACEFRQAHQFGIQSIEPQIDFERTMEHVHKVMNILSVNDSVERFTKLGVKVIQAQGRFIDANTLAAGNEIIKARRFVIATSSSPAIPSIPGLNHIPFYTNKTIFEIKKKPEHLIVIGGGPIGCELAQAFLYLGSRVILLEASTILPRDELDLVDILRQHLLRQGLVIHEGINITKVEKLENQIQVTFEKNGKSEAIVGSALLVATGRYPRIQQLNLEQAKVHYSSKGIKVDTRLRTSNKRIYAIGDVVGSYQFTHVASYHAGIVIRNILFRWPAKVNYCAVPWVTYTEPELAHVGMSSSDALKENPTAQVLTWDFKENDRAQAEHQTLGNIKVIVNKNGKILGVTILGAHAGELILPWIMAIQENKTIKSLASTIVPYPTLSEISKRVAGEFYTPILFSERTKKLVRFLSLFG